MCIYRTLFEFKRLISLNDFILDNEIPTLPLKVI